MNNAEKLWPESSAYWTDKRVIVTGGAGFLGSAIVRRLSNYDCGQIIVPRSADYDLRTMGAVRRLFNDAGPTDVVIHLAARVGGIGFNQAHPAELFYDNAMIGLHLMEESRQRGVGKVVAVGTICSYPKHTAVPFQEEDLWAGYPEETNAPYGIAKKMMLVQAQAYRKQYGFNSIYLLPVNLYGPGDNFDPESSHVIPAIIKKCVDARNQGKSEIVVWGDGRATREFLYVDEAAEGIQLATERYNGEEPVNLGSACEISIKDLVSTIVQATGFPGHVTWDTTKPNGQPRRKLDTSRAESCFGFRSRMDFKTGLERTVEWYREVYAADSH